jgi:hypothetical protein
MKINHLTAVVISGIVWFVIGLFLLTKGLNLLVFNEGGRDEMALICIAGGLIVGFLKGRFILSKTARRTCGRIFSLPSPFPLNKIYPLSYYGLIAVMMGIGVVFRWLPVTLHGFVDVAVGSALINGSLFYFRILLNRKKDYL